MNKEKLGSLIVSPIKKSKYLTPSNSRIPVKSYDFSIPEIAAKASPGQFVMMWVYDIDEKPMGIAGIDGDIVSFAVAKSGEATSAFHNLKIGDLVGIRGPYGKSFNLKGSKIAIMGGGTGIAPTKFLTEVALKQGIEVSLFHGARTENELAYADYFKALEQKTQNFHYHPSTDDGTFGFKGFSTQCLQDAIIKGNKFESLYTCGPELMMYFARDIAKKENYYFEASLADRYFKCAIGLCGQCTVDPTGQRICIDGPVFNLDQLELIADFGKFGRDKFGRKITLDNKSE
ncbi:MAG: dihydroorotate dehydrogenase electron transfer subunit [Candidatus Thorarchaeota archaeon]